MNYSSTTSQMVDILGDRDEILKIWSYIQVTSKMIPQYHIGHDEGNKRRLIIWLTSSDAEKLLNWLGEQSFSQSD